MRLLLTGITINPFVIKYIPEECFNSMVLFSTRRDAVDKRRALARAVTFFAVNFTLFFFFFLILAANEYDTSQSWNISFFGPGTQMADPA